MQVKSEKMYVHLQVKLIEENHIKWYYYEKLIDSFLAAVYFDLWTGASHTSHKR